MTLHLPLIFLMARVLFLNAMPSIMSSDMKFNYGRLCICLRAAPPLAQEASSGNFFTKSEKGTAGPGRPMRSTVPSESALEFVIQKTL